MRSLSLIPAVAALSFVAAPLAAQEQAVTITSKIEVVKEVTDATGAKKRTLVEPKLVVPGDPLVIWISYRNTSGKPATNFVINNPIPKAVNFTGLGENSGWAIVSVDGGKTFGPLASLKVPRADKTLRAAIPADVTHIRWAFPRPVAAGASGTLSFYGIVK